MEKRIALVTCSKYPNLTESDRVLATALAANGAKVSAIDWREHGDWSEFSVAVVRSTWDYHLHANEFNVWVDQVERATALINSPALLRWNSNKRYLLDLAKRHVRVLPCLVVRPGAEVPWRDLELAGWRDLVVKPLVGASAWQIVRTSPENLTSAITTDLQASGYLIQPFAVEVAAGEYSLIFFDGRFSHAVLKQPHAADFRTQQEHGASISVVTPDQSLIAAAGRILGALPTRPTYARIDGIVQDGEFVLMEAELIEPELFFHLVPEAADTFAQAILRHAK